MTQATNTFDTYDAVGIREDLQDVIYSISPTETPFMSAAAREQVKNTFHEWQTDSLAAAVTNNAVIEGDEATLDASTATSRIGNYTQIMDKTVVITGTQEAVDKAGRASELAYQIAKKSKELKRDIESTLLTNQARAVGSSSAARTFASMGAWIATNSNKASDGTDPTASDGSDARNDGTQRSLTEDMLKDVIKGTWNAGGNPSVIMVGPFNKQKISGFTGGNTRFDASEDKTLYTSIDVYSSDFGDLEVVPNRFSRDRDALVLDMDYWSVGFLRDFTMHELSKTGDAEKRQILAELTLISRNEGASGGVFDLTTSY
jgi:hypothetical protein